MADQTQHHAPQQGEFESEDAKLSGQINKHPDLSVWLVWGGTMLAAIAILPFAVRNQDLVKAFARLCGFDID